MKLDHLVYFSTENPGQTVKAQLQHGRNAIIGGSHKSWGTQNALLYTKNAYIEWLSIENQDIALKSHQPLTQQLIHDLKRGQGWGNLCLAVNAIKNLHHKLIQKGFKFLKYSMHNAKHLKEDCCNGKCCLSINRHLMTSPIHFLSSGQNRKTSGEIDSKLKEPLHILTKEFALRDVY